MNWRRFELYHSLEFLAKSVGKRDVRKWLKEIEKKKKKRKKKKRKMPTCCPSKPTGSPVKTAAFWSVVPLLNCVVISHSYLTIHI